MDRLFTYTDVRYLSGCSVPIRIFGSYRDRVRSSLGALYLRFAMTRDVGEGERVSKDSLSSWRSRCPERPLRRRRGQTSPMPHALGGVTTHGSVDKERSPEIPSASAMSGAQRAPGTPRDAPINETMSAVNQPRPRKSASVTAPSRLARRAPDGARASGTCAYVGSGAPSRCAS